MQNERVRRNLAEIHAYLSYTKPVGRIGKICEMHYHDEVELLLMTGGKLACCMDGETIIASKGQVLFVESLVPHWTESESEDCSYILLQFIPDDFEPGNRPGRLPNHPLYRLARTSTQSAHLIDDPTVASAIQTIWDEYVPRKAGAGKFILAGIYQLIGWLERSGYLSADALPDDQSVQKLLPALEYIDRHYGMQLPVDMAKTGSRSCVAQR